MERTFFERALFFQPASGTRLPLGLPISYSALVAVYALQAALTLHEKSTVQNRLAQGIFTPNGSLHQLGRFPIYTCAPSALIL
jgi:hypothetical protein